MKAKTKSREVKPLKINYYSSKIQKSNLNYHVDASTERLYYETYRYNSLPSYNPAEAIRICVLSDTHDEHSVLEQLPPCDILIHAGDIMMKSRKLSIEQAVNKLIHFKIWMKVLYTIFSLNVSTYAITLSLSIYRHSIEPFN